MKRQKAFLIIDILLLIITLAFIWLSSLESASESAEKSEGLLIAIAPILELFLSADRINEHMIRKLAHFIEFALLGGELILLCVIDRRTRPQQVINCLSASLAVAVIDEALQLLSDRDPQITDVLLDFSGAVFGILFVLLIPRTSAHEKAPKASLKLSKTPGPLKGPGPFPCPELSYKIPVKSFIIGFLDDY